MLRNFVDVFPKITMNTYRNRSILQKLTFCQLVALLLLFTVEGTLIKGRTYPLPHVLPKTETGSGKENTFTENKILISLNV